MCRPFPSTRLKHTLLGGLALAACLLTSSCALLGLAASAGVVKLQFGCLVEGEEIDTPSGPVPVEKIAVGDQVIGYDGVPVTVLRIDEYPEDPARSGHLAVCFADGEEIHLSPRHRIAGLPAGGLDPGDVLNGHVVSGIRPLSGVTRSFDILTEDRGYRIHGVPVNSMIREMEAATAGIRPATGS